MYPCRLLLWCTTVDTLVLNSPPFWKKKNNIYLISYAKAILDLIRKLNIYTLYFIWFYNLNSMLHAGKLMKLVFYAIWHLIWNNNDYITYLKSYNIHNYRMCRDEYVMYAQSWHIYLMCFKKALVPTGSFGVFIPFILPLKFHLLKIHFAIMLNHTASLLLDTLKWSYNFPAFLVMQKWQGSFVIICPI